VPRLARAGSKVTQDGDAEGSGMGWLWGAGGAALDAAGLAGEGLGNRILLLHRVSLTD